MEHVAAGHVGAAVETEAPAKVTKQVVGAHVIALLPVFLIVMAKATGLAEDDAPPVNETDTTWMEELVDAEPARL